MISTKDNKTLKTPKNNNTKKAGYTVHLNNQNSQNFEFYCIDLHKNNYQNQITYHWLHIPYELLYESKCCPNIDKFREKILLAKKNGTGLNVIKEYGIDGLSYEIVDGIKVFHALQMKLYSKKSYLTGSDLGTFLGVNSLLYFNNNKSRGYLYYTCKLEQNIENILNSTFYVPISLENPFENNAFDKHNNLKLLDEKIDNLINSIDSEISGFSHVLRYYQIEAIQKLSICFNNVKNNIKLLNIICGCGKTTITTEHIKDKKYKHVFIFSPLRVLAKQNLERFKKDLVNCETKYEYILVDSDSEGHRDINVIREKMNSSACVFSITYDSYDIILQLFHTNVTVSNDGSEDVSEDVSEEDVDESIEISDDSNCTYEESTFSTDCDFSNSFVIVDEAHNLTSVSDNFIKMLKSFNNVLLLTGTPPNILDDKISHEVVYEYGMSKAIEDKFICDYNIYLPLIENNAVDIDIPEELTESALLLDNDILKKALFLVNSILLKGSRRCICYMNSIEECNIFEKVINDIMDKYHGCDYIVYKMNCETSSAERNFILNNFEKPDDDGKSIIRLLLNIRILNEGIDIIKCDSVFIGNISDNSNIISMVQRICRANRLDNDNKNKIANCYFYCDDLNKCVNSLQLLKTNDIDFVKKIHYIDSNFKKTGSSESIEKVIGYNKELEKFINVKCISLNDMWEMKRQLLFQFVFDNNGKIPTQKTHKIMNYWFSRQKNKIKTINDTIYKKLSENPIIKQNLDTLFEKRKIEKIDLSEEQKIEALIQYVIDKNELPQAKTEIMLNGKMWKIGSYYNHIKKIIKSIDSPLYIQLTNAHETFQENLSVLFEKRTIEKIDLSEEEKIEELIKYVIDKNELPQYRTEIMLNGKMWKIGSYYNDIKKKIKSIDSPLYIQLTNSHMKFRKNLSTLFEKRKKEKIDSEKK